MAVQREIQETEKKMKGFVSLSMFNSISFDTSELATKEELHILESDLENIRKDNNNFVDKEELLVRLNSLISDINTKIKDFPKMEYIKNITNNFNNRFESI